MDKTQYFRYLLRAKYLIKNSKDLTRAEKDELKGLLHFFGDREITKDEWVIFEGKYGEFKSELDVDIE